MNPCFFLFIFQQGLAHSLFYGKHGGVAQFYFCGRTEVLLTVGSQTERISRKEPLVRISVALETTNGLTHLQLQLTTAIEKTKNQQSDVARMMCLRTSFRKIWVFHGRCAS